MDAATALDWLRKHQRLPDDAPEDTIDALDEVRRHLIEHPDPQCIPLVLGVFEDHMALGVFQLFDDVLARYSQDQLTPHLKHALQSDNQGTRWWAAHWAMQFVSPELAEPLEAILNNPADEDSHYFAADALAQIYRLSPEPRILAALRARAGRETDEELGELLRESLEEFDSGEA